MSISMVWVNVQLERWGVAETRWKQTHAHENRKWILKKQSDGHLVNQLAAARVAGARCCGWR